jgi:vancomycin resistance protein YoaR
LVKPIFRDVEPELTAKEAEEYGIKELISSFTTDYNPRQTNRVANIKLLARLLDGQLVAPGEIFSFNGRIGPRTLERGFLPAPTIINGQLVDTAGGGACQVGTTLFNAAFFAGLKIIERHNHSFYISHYPAGRDATVSYGGYDLKFKNDYQSWILIKAWATQSRITISFYGTAEGRKVRFETLGPFDFKPYKVREVKDANLPFNYRKVEDKGIKGRRYVVIRYVYDKLGNLLYKDKFVSIYRPKDEIVRVGIKKTEETTVTTQAANN